WNLHKPDAHRMATDAISAALPHLAPPPQPREGMVPEKCPERLRKLITERIGACEYSVIGWGNFAEWLWGEVHKTLAAAPGEPVSDPDKLPPVSLNEPFGDSEQLPDDAPFPEGWDEGRKYRCVTTGRRSCPC